MTTKPAPSVEQLAEEYANQVELHIPSSPDFSERKVYLEFIDQLKDAWLAGYAAGAARWVPVEEMLPAEDGLYCVMQEFQNTIYMSAKHFCDGQWDAANKVTHWLDNVPEVPK